MQFPQIRMESQMAKIGIKQTPAQIELQQGKADVTIEQPKAEMSIRQPKGKLTIDDFENNELDIEFQSLRIPLTEKNYSLSERPGYLRLSGRDGLSSRYNQSLIARRWSDFEFEAETKIEFQADGRINLFI